MFITNKYKGLRCRVHVTDKYMGPRAGPQPTCGPYICRLTDEYNLYIHRLTDEFRIFLLLPVLGVSPDGEPPKHALYNRISCISSTIQHNSTQFITIQHKTSYSGLKLLTNHTNKLQIAK
jgi:hypothetical protein